MFIDSPDLEALGVAMERFDPVSAYQGAARETGSEHLEPIVARLTAEAGGSDDLVGAVGTYTDESGEVYVGVPGSSPSAEEMHRIEYGSASAPPAAPIRLAVAMRGREVDAEFGSALGRRLEEVLRK